MNIRSIARKPFFDTFFLYNFLNNFSNPIMPQTLRLALSDSLSYDGKIGGPNANFNFSKYKKLKENKGLSVKEKNYIFLEYFQNYQRYKHTW